MSVTLPRLIVITDWSRGDAALLRALQAVCALGPQVAVQHRHPEAPTRQFLSEARELSDLCRAHGVPLFVNGRLDVALRVDAHLHLPAHGFEVSEVRPHLPTGRLVSVAVHDAHEAGRAAGADLALLSPVFGAGSKPGDARAPQGVAGFEALARRTGCPVYALGGITPASAPALRGKVAGLAAVTGVLDAADPHAAAQTLLDIVRGRGP